MDRPVLLSYISLLYGAHHGSPCSITIHQPSLWGTSRIAQFYYHTSAFSTGHTMHRPVLLPYISFLYGAHHGSPCSIIIYQPSLRGTPWIALFYYHTSAFSTGHTMDRPVLLSYISLLYGAHHGSPCSITIHQPSLRDTPWIALFYYHTSAFSTGHTMDRPVLLPYISLLYRAHHGSPCSIAIHQPSLPGTPSYATPPQPHLTL